MTEGAERFMETVVPPNEDGAPAPSREAYWRKRLGRIRLGAEPVAEQLERYRRVTITFIAVAGTVGLMFVGLFTAFRQPVVGATVALVLMGPLMLVCWLDFVRLRGRVAEYQRETEGEVRKDGGGPGGSEPPPPAA